LSRSLTPAQLAELAERHREVDGAAMAQRPADADEVERLLGVSRELRHRALAAAGEDDNISLVLLEHLSAEGSRVRVRTWLPAGPFASLTTRQPTLFDSKRTNR
jgi:hypothetical protein